MLEEMERTACRVLGQSHPTSIEIGLDLKMTREALRARESRCPSGPGPLFFAFAVGVFFAWLWRYLFLGLPY